MKCFALLLLSIFAVAQDGTVTWRAVTRVTTVKSRCRIGEQCKVIPSCDKGHKPPDFSPPKGGAGAHNSPCNRIVPSGEVEACHG